MAINTPSEIAADLQIGITDQGMVRLYISNDTVDLPLDFAPDDAAEIADEILAAVQAAKKRGLSG
ncbi:MAG: DUF6324 family protein [Parvularculaceae bacterium]